MRKSAMDVELNRVARDKNTPPPERFRLIAFAGLDSTNQCSLAECIDVGMLHNFCGVPPDGRRPVGLRVESQVSVAGADGRAAWGRRGLLLSPDFRSESSDL